MLNVCVCVSFQSRVACEWVLHKEGIVRIAAIGKRKQHIIIWIRLRPTQWKSGKQYKLSSDCLEYPISLIARVKAHMTF